MEKIKNVGVILAAGIGSRFGSNKPKQFYEVNDKEIISYVIDTFNRVSSMDAFIVVVGKEDVLSGRTAEKYGVKVIAGGESRAQSFFCAIEYISEYYSDCKKVIFHEAVRPMVSESVFEKYYELLEQYDYVETCKHITDSLGCYGDEIPKRENYFLIQAPEAYRFDKLKKYFKVDSDIYFAAHQFPPDCKGYRYFDVENNFKLTYPEDLGLITYFLTKGKVV